MAQAAAAATMPAMASESWEYKSVRLTTEAGRAWDRACTRRGVTMTALMQALGEQFGEEDWLPEQAIVRAREIDRERRSRR